MKVGDVMHLDGFFTRLLWVAGKAPNDLERVIGYHGGRLSQGYIFAALKDRLRSDEVELVGMSHFSGGRIGHPSIHGRVKAEDSLRGAFGEGLVQRQRQIAAETLNAGGSDTAVKVLPNIRHDPSMNNALQYPVGDGIPQYNLLVKKDFVVVALVGPGGTAPKVPDVLRMLPDRAA